MDVNEQWLVTAFPDGALRPEDFTWSESPLQALEPGQVRVRTQYISLDPTNRVWFSKGTYLDALKVGDVMPGGAIGIVEASRADGHTPGDLVQGMWGWQSHATSDGSDLAPLPALPPGLPVTAHFGLLGHIGLTAHHGMLGIGRPRPGETVVVSAAAGAVGSLAGQIAKLQGTRVVGIAGGAAKGRHLVEDLGFDAAVDHRGDDLDAALEAACPDGVDVYFDNVGGAVLDAVLGQINQHGRVVACGMISQYNHSGGGHAFEHLTNLVTRRISLTGFNVTDHFDEAAAVNADLIAWHAEGRLQYAVDVVPGLASAPTALARLFDGSHTGKLILQVAA